MLIRPRKKPKSRSEKRNVACGIKNASKKRRTYNLYRGHLSEIEKEESISLSKSFKADPTIEHYLRLRESFPGVPIEIATSDGIEFVFKFEKEIKELGFDPRQICGILDADLDYQSFVSLKLLEKLTARRAAVSRGQTHVVSAHGEIGDALVNYIIGACLDALSWNDNLEISRDLIVLIKHQLKLEDNVISREVEKRDNAFNAHWIGGQLISMGKEPSFRLVGKIMGVSASTVMRWFPDGDFRQQAERSSRLFENGKLKPLEPVRREPNT